MARPSLLLALGLLVPLALACAPSVADLCDAACDCEGDACDDREYDSCVRQGERIEDAAVDLGCEAELDAYVECADDELECKDGVVSTEACKVEEKGLDDCLDQDG